MHSRNIRRSCLAVVVVFIMMLQLSTPLIMAMETTETSTTSEASDTTEKTTTDKDDTTESKNYLTALDKVASIVASVGTKERDLDLPPEYVGIDSNNEVQSVKISWLSKTYDGDKKGIYTFTGTLAQEYTTKDSITMEVAVADHCTCEDSEGKQADIHDSKNEKCALYGKEVVKIKLKDDTTFYVAKEDASIYTDAGATVEKTTEATTATKKKTKSLKGVSAGANDTRMNTVMKDHTDAQIRSYTAAPEGIYTTPSSGIDLPNAWKNYIATMWQYRATGDKTNTNGDTSGQEFKWTERSEMGTNVSEPWTGQWPTRDNTGTDETTGNAQATADRDVKPYRVMDSDNNEVRFTVYSAEQFRYALAWWRNKIKNSGANTSNDEINASIIRTTYRKVRVIIAKDLDLDGANQNWNAISFYNPNVTTLKHPRVIFENGKTDGTNVNIFNLGKYHASTGDQPTPITGETGTAYSSYNANHAAGLIIGYGGLEASNINFKTAKIVASDGSRCPAVGIFGQSETSKNNWSVVSAGRPADESRQKLENINIEGSLFYNGNDEGDTQGNVSAIGVLATNQGGTDAANLGANINKVGVSGCYIYAGDHAAGFTVGNYTGITKNSYVENTLIATTGGHSGGFMSCNVGSRGHNDALDRRASIENCFSDVDMYAATYSGGFVGLYSGDIKNCYSTGKLVGYRDCGGFSVGTFNGGVYAPTTVKQCYSTVLIGMRVESTYMGGFHAPAIHGYNSGSINKSSSYTFNDCYAAGEVGGISVDTSGDDEDATYSGGFFSMQGVNSGVTGTNASDGRNDTAEGYCYYDKQTTAMREKGAANFTMGSTSVPSQVAGLSGVLSDSYEYEESGTKNYVGLACPSEGAAASADDGFKGFSDNSKWVYFPGHYPQLAVFANAESSSWGEGQADIVTSYSKASTSTVFLNNWNQGYTWDNVGDRSSSEVNYSQYTLAAGETHRGNSLTYDTVREVITDFNTTEDASYTHEVKPSSTTDNGANVEITDDTTITKSHAINIDNAVRRVYVNDPGMDWIQITDATGSKVGNRPIRVITSMSVYAGKDQNVYAGVNYDHRKEVKLTASSELTPNLIVGLNDNDIWSKAVTVGYPKDVSGDYQKSFWEVKTDNMDAANAGNTAIQDAWLYTEVWEVKQAFLKSGQTASAGDILTDSTKLIGDPSIEANQYWYVEADTDGNMGIYLRTQEGASPNTTMDPYVDSVAASVSGAGTGSGTTIDERKWNGEISLYPDTSTGRKYQVTYYWLMEDGRYRTDYKIITIMPGQYNLYTGVYNAPEDISSATLNDFKNAATASNLNPFALKLDAQKDKYTPGTGMTDGKYDCQANISFTGAGTKATEIIGPAGTDFPGETGFATNKTDSIGYTRDATTAWKVLNNKVKVQGLRLSMLSREGEVMGTAVVKNANGIDESNHIDIAVKYYGVTTSTTTGKEITTEETVTVRYNIKKSTRGEYYYLSFCKLLNAPAATYGSPEELGTQTDGSSVEGLPSPAAGVKAYINDTMYNLRIDLFVESKNFKLSKKITGNYANLSDKFQFDVTIEGLDVDPSVTEMPYKSIKYSGAGITDGTFTLSGTTETETKTFELGHGQGVNITNLPAGLKYTVVEKPDGNGTPTSNPYITTAWFNGTQITATSEPTGGFTDTNPAYYVSSTKTTKGLIVTSTDKDENLVYENKRVVTTPTGLLEVYWPYILLIIAVIVSTVYYMYRRHKKKKDGGDSGGLGNIDGLEGLQSG